MNLYPLLAAVVGGEIIDLVGETGPVAKAVLLILLIFSLVSWAIILSKWSVLRRARVQSGRFVRAFRKAQRLQVKPCTFNFPRKIGIARVAPLFAWPDDRHLTWNNIP